MARKASSSVRLGAVIAAAVVFGAVAASAATATSPRHSVPPARYGAAVQIAERYLGVPYVWGGASPSGFDDSGLVKYVYAQLGVTLQHYIAAQYAYRHAVSVKRRQLQPGDLVFFDGLAHVGIYIGGNQFIHAPHTGAVVRIDSLTGWYRQAYYGAKRILR